MNYLYVPNLDVSFLKRSFLWFFCGVGCFFFFPRSRSKGKKKTKPKQLKRQTHKAKGKPEKFPVILALWGRKPHRARWCQHPASHLPGARLLQQGPRCSTAHSRVRLLSKPSSFLEWSLARDIRLLLLTYSTHNLVASCSRHYII